MGERADMRQCLCACVYVHAGRLLFNGRRLIGIQLGSLVQQAMGEAGLIIRQPLVIENPNTLHPNRSGIDHEGYLHTSR